MTRILYTINLDGQARHVYLRSPGEFLVGWSYNVLDDRYVFTHRDGPYYHVTRQTGESIGDFKLISVVGRKGQHFMPLAGIPDDQWDAIGPTI